MSLWLHWVNERRILAEVVKDQFVWGNSSSNDTVVLVNLWKIFLTMLL